MLMVYLIGFGACVSAYLLVKHKKKIAFELLKYYTYLDEYFTQIKQSDDTSYLYPFIDNNTLQETGNLNNALIAIKDRNLNFIISKDFLTFENEDKSKHVSKVFYSIFFFDNNINSNETEHTFPLLPSISTNGIIINEYVDELNNVFFENKMQLFQNIHWSPPILASSISIRDKNKIYNFIEYDITTFIISIVKKNVKLILNNSNENKQLWINIFNFIFKEKNIFIPCQLSDIENYTISWTIIKDNCEILEGNEIELNV